MGSRSMVPLSSKRSETNARRVVGCRRRCTRNTYFFCVLLLSVHVIWLILTMANVWYQNQVKENEPK